MTGGSVNITDVIASLGNPQVLAGVSQWLNVESLAPQTVDVVPFPTPQLTVNPYGNTMISVFGIIFIMGILLPGELRRRGASVTAARIALLARLFYSPGANAVYSNVRAIVREREERLREAMLIVGLSEGALYLSWWITYTLLYAVIGEGRMRLIPSRALCAPSHPAWTPHPPQHSSQCSSLSTRSFSSLSRATSSPCSSSSARRTPPSPTSFRSSSRLVRGEGSDVLRLPCPHPSLM